MKKIFILTLLSGFFSITKAQSTLAEHHFESGEITKVTVMGAFCDVYVTNGSRVVFDGIINGRGQKDDFLIASIRNGDQVIFKVERIRSNSWSWDNIEKARFDLVIPDGVALIIDNSSGDVKVEDLSGSVYRVEASSGDILIKGLTGDLSVRSTSGDQVIRNITGSLSAGSTSGDQEFEYITGSLRTTATSGDVYVTSQKGDLFIKATSGDIDLSGIEGRLAVETTSGNIEGDRITLSGDAFVKATSGNVFLDFENDLEEIGFDLKASSGDLEVGTIEAENKLVLRRGTLSLQGITTSGDQRYKN